VVLGIVALVAVGVLIGILGDTTNAQSTSDGSMGVP